MSPKGSRDLVPEERLTFPQALESVRATIERANPGQTVIVDRGHTDRDGKYFTVTVTTREHLQQQSSAELSERLKEVERQREEQRDFADRYQLAHAREQERAEKAEAALADRDRQVRALIQKWERSGEEIEANEGGETRASRLFFNLARQLDRDYTQPSSNPPQQDTFEQEERSGHTFMCGPPQQDREDGGVAEISRELKEDPDAVARIARAINTATISDAPEHPRAIAAIDAVFAYFVATQPEADPEVPRCGVELIAAERRRQVEAEGWTPEHDDEHRDGQLAKAAACYARPSAHQDAPGCPPGGWPWEEQWWKPVPGDRVRNLVKAGALVAAEIDRLQRANGVDLTQPVEEEAIDLTVVVSGAPVQVSAAVEASVEDVIETALAKLKMPRVDYTTWTLRRVDGSAVAPGNVAAANLTSGLTLFLDPDAGGGASTQPPSPQAEVQDCETCNGSGEKVTRTEVPWTDVAVGDTLSIYTQVSGAEYEYLKVEVVSATEEAVAWKYWHGKERELPRKRLDGTATRITRSTCESCNGTGKQPPAEVVPDCDDLCTCGHERFHHDDGREMGVETNCKARRDGRPCTCQQFNIVEDEKVVEQPPAEPQGDVVEILASWAYAGRESALAHFEGRDDRLWADLTEGARDGFRAAARNLLPRLTPLLALEVKERLEGLPRLSPTVEYRQFSGQGFRPVAVMKPALDGDYLDRGLVVIPDTPAPSEPEEG